MRKLYLFLFISILGLMFHSCVLVSRYTVENDIVYSSKKVKWEHIYRPMELRSPLYSVNQTIIKEIRANEVTFKVYDIVSLIRNSFQLEDKVFLIVDKSEVIPMIIENTEHENLKTIAEEKKDILTADSTKVSIVTGYTEDNRKIARLSYSLNQSMVDKIDNSKEIMFRYYSGPDMITIKLTGYDLNKLKRLIRTQ